MMLNEIAGGIVFLTPHNDSLYVKMTTGDYPVHLAPLYGLSDWHY